MAKKTLTATMPDGSKLTRTTAREYKYVVYCHYENRPYYALSWTTRRDLLEKELYKYRNHIATIGYAEVNA